MAARSRSRRCCPPLCLLAFLSTLAISLAADTLGRGESIRDGQTLVSAGGVFELGFFSPNGSSKRYVGIWYKNIAVETVVWVGNRKDPFADASGELTLDSYGNLMIRGNGAVDEVVLMEGTGGRSGSNAALMDSGNFVLREGGSGQPLWQSFDYPTDTWLPGMRLGSTGEYHRRLTSWRSPTDPSRGDYSFQDERTQLVVMQKDTPIWNSGVLALGGHTRNPWDSCDAIRNLRYTGDSNGSQESFEYDASPYTRFVMDVEGQIRLWTWTFRKWTMLWAMPEGSYKCVSTSSCGPNGLYNATATPTCNCLPGFDPDSHSKWFSGDWSDGCSRRRRRDFECAGDGFFFLGVQQYPVLGSGFVSESSLDCRRSCLANCNCTAYGWESWDDGKIAGCFMWFGQLMGLQENRTRESELYIRLAAPDRPAPPPPPSSTDTSAGGNVSTVTNEKPRQQTPGGSLDPPSKKPVDVPDSGIKLLLSIVLPIVSVTILLFGVALCCFLGVKCGGHREESGEELVLRDIGRDGAVTYKFVDTNEGAAERGPEIHVYSFSNVLAATNNFSDDNKLGQGGFGPVYKGKLPGGQEIAIKRLSTRSGQGLEEFKTEILLIARLQHKNLVRLLGCCIQGEERLLIYEYMPNKSLDFFLFDPKRAAQLDWDRRNQIIEGISQGLLYLHKYSRLTIIHRDLKASNILLDNEMNPKISDFGMARIFNSNEDQASTNRIVGTYGYMSPEYAMEGVFSVKSDVFSFGVLLLEIVSGKKNIGSHRYFPIPRSLLGYAWELWNAGRELELMDPLLGGSCPGREVSRCIYVGLSCVQECANDRPTMTEVVAMLSSENPARQAPKQPAFLTGTSSSSDSAAAKSTNDMTISALEGR